MLRWRQITSSRISAGRCLASIAPATVSIVVGARSWPRSISPTSSSTTAAASRTSPSSPSRVSTLPRRCTSQPTLSSSSRSTASSEPASSAAMVLSSVSCVRANALPGSPLPGQPLPYRSADPLAVGAPLNARHDQRHHLAQLTGLRCPGFLDRAADQLAELAVGELLGQVPGDQLRLGLLGTGTVLASAPAEALGRLQPLLALPPQNGELVVLAQLRVLLQRAREHAQRTDPIALAGLHRLAGVGLNLLEDAHGYRVAAGWRAAHGPDD